MNANKNSSVCSSDIGHLPCLSYHERISISGHEFKGFVLQVSFAWHNPLKSKGRGSYDRGRDASYPAPPAQIRTGPIKASGSCLGWLAASCRSMRLVARDPAPVTRFPGPVPGTCFAGPRSPRSPSLAPPAPQRIAPLCSSASLLLRRSQTSRVRASSATTPRLPDAGLRNPPAGQTRDLPVPAQRASTHARVFDHAGSGGRSQ